MMSIGEFARAVNLSVSAVRFYADRGLLRPAATDATTGYRYYEQAQVSLGSLIRDLRLMEMPLSEIAGVLRLDASARESTIKAHVQQLEARLAQVRGVARSLTSVTDTGAGVTTVDSADLARAIVQVGTAAGGDPRQPHHMCVLVEMRDSSLRLAATDSYRLGVRDLVVSTIGRAFSAVVAAAEIGSWPTALADAGEITLEVSDEILIASGDDLALRSPILPVEFPDYEAVLASSADNTTTVIADRQELVSLFASFTGDGTITLAASDGELMVARDGNERRIMVEISGNEAHLAINPRFAADAVAQAVGAEVVIEIDDALRPITLRSADDGTYTSRLMPVHLA